MAPPESTWFCPYRCCLKFSVPGLVLKLRSKPLELATSQSGGSSCLGLLPPRCSLSLRSKRKVLGRKEPGDTFGSRPNSHSPVKTSGSPTSESPAAVVSTGKSSSRNEDFKALLQKKSSKTSAGTRPSAAELLKTTNPLARRVMTEFAPELDGANSPKSQP